HRKWYRRTRWCWSFCTGRKSVRRREFIALMGASVAWPLAALGQQPGRMYRVGLLWAATPESPVVVAFLDEMARHGFVVGKNLTVAYRAFDRLPEYAAELSTARWMSSALRGTWQFALHRRQRRPFRFLPSR